VAPFANGGFVVTWMSDGQDGSGPGLYVQLFDNSANKVGAEFSVNTYTDHARDMPSAAGLSGGGFVVTWAPFEQDGSDWGVYGQVFDSNGTKVGSEFLVNTTTTGDQVCPSIASLSGGGFVVTWESDGQDGSYYGVYGQVFDSAGNRMGSEFRLNTHTSNDQGDTSGAGVSGDGFVVTWHSRNQDGSEWGVYGRRYSFEQEVYRDELILDFGPAHGLWHYDRTRGFDQWNTVSPSQMVVVDLNGDGMDELVAAFRGDGLYSYVPTDGRRQINTEIPEDMIRYGDGIACDFGAAYGLWIWSESGGWRRINDVEADKMIAADIDGDGEDELIVSFTGYGLYFCDDPGVWTQINTVIPENMIRLNNGIVCDFGATHGLWIWTQAGGWEQWNPADPDKVLAVDIDHDGEDELVASFAGYGLYRRNETGFWTLMNTVIPENMIRLNNGIGCDFGAANGLWTWTQGGGWHQWNTVDPAQMTVVDIDNDGVEAMRRLIRC
jgi:hypothetical protein